MASFIKQSVLLVLHYVQVLYCAVLCLFLQGFLENW